MYSAHLFEHKQIFAIREMKSMLDELGLDGVLAKRFRELSFPIQLYLEKLIQCRRLARLLDTPTRGLLAAQRIENKMTVGAENPLATSAQSRTSS